MKTIIRKIALFGCLAAGLGMTSCEDFLTITPTSSIVEEKFWQDKNDLNNALYACYRRMASEDILSDCIYWGEMRGDDFERSTNTTATGQVANIMNANLLPTYSIFGFESMYNAINYCNKVLAHGPQVVANDESMSEGDWIPIRAEVITLRALCHFYLVRAYGEIPYVTQDYNNDSQELRLQQSTQLEVLDSIVNDLESVKDQAMSDYGNTVLNKGRITKKAVYALLADVYLWRASYKAGNCHPFINREIPSYNVLYTDGTVKLAGDDTPYGSSAQEDYQKCLDCCDKVIEIAKNERVEYLNKSGLNVGGGNVDVELADLLEKNDHSDETSIMSSSVDAYESLFGTGNSDESIFEIQFDGTTYSNSMLTSRFWSIKDSKAGDLTGASSLVEAVEPNPNVLIPSSMYTKTDYRRWESFMYTSASQTSFDVCKYINNEAVQSSSASSSFLTDNAATKLTVNYDMRSSSNVDANFIFYRMSEIYLMKAEAMSQLYSDETNLQKAFNYVREVFKRSNPYAYEASNGTAANDSLKFDYFNTSENLEYLVMAERQREFIGEGKRWFDLVRYAQRRGSTQKMLEILCRKYTSNQKSIKAKLADMQSLFNPIYENELKNNTWLYQNGAWSTTSSTGRTDNL